MTNLKKAYVQAIEGRDQEPIEVLFNPAEYTLEKSNQYQSTPLPGMPNPVIQFANGNADTLNMELLFDSYTDGDKEEVSRRVSRLARLLDVDRSLHAPPRVRFVWGKFQFEAVLERLSQRFTMFLDNGLPVRATASVIFRQYKTVRTQIEEIGRESADRAKRHYVTQDDSLWALAATEYGDPARWRHIARANPSIDNPRLLTVGDELAIPPLPAMSASELVTREL